MTTKEEQAYNRIGEVLDSQGRTQSWLADQLGSTRNSVNMIYLNKSQPNLEKLFKIAGILNVPAYTLIGDYNPDNLRAELWEGIKGRVEDDKTSQQ